MSGTAGQGSSLLFFDDFACKMPVCVQNSSLFFVFFSWIPRKIHTVLRIDIVTANQSRKGDSMKRKVITGIAALALCASVPAVTAVTAFAGDQFQKPAAAVTEDEEMKNNEGMNFGQMPEGEMPPVNGELPAPPEGEMPEFDGELPAPPEGEMPEFDGELPAPPEGGFPGFGGGMPKQPKEGKPGEDGEFPEPPAGEKPEFDDVVPELPEDLNA